MQTIREGGDPVWLRIEETTSDSLTALFATFMVKHDCLEILSSVHNNAEPIRGWEETGQIVVGSLNLCDRYEYLLALCRPAGEENGRLRVLVIRTADDWEILVQKYFIAKILRVHLRHFTEMLKRADYPKY